MASIEIYRLVRACARIDGGWLGLIWVVSFSCLIGGISYPMVQSGFTVLALLSPFFVASRLKRFRNNSLNGTIGFFGALSYSLYCFFYAALILAMAQFVYFQYIDQGYFMGQIVASLIKPEMKQVLMAYGMTQAQLDTELNLLSQTRPIDFAISFLSFNILIGAMLSLPIALLLKSDRPLHTNTNNKH